MRKIAFYINNSRCTQHDFRFLDKGNPGIGGTPYLIVLIASELAKRDNDLNVTLYVDADGVFCNELNVKKTNDCFSSIFDADKEEYDFMVVNSMYINWDHFDFSAIKSKLRLIPWCHNFNKYSWNRIFYKQEKIARFITVSKEQLDLLRDHSVFDKGDYIFNAVPFDSVALNLKTLSPQISRKHTVVFMGSLLWGKSFHVLASIWPDILKEVPDAELFIIGSGNLYNKSSRAGKYGLAPEAYESIFIKHLISDDGSILSSVHFLGNLGLDKFDVLREMKVGVPNPRGTGETFCISAVEMQIVGCNVVSMEAPGYLDTVYNGKLTKSKASLRKAIIDLLHSDQPIKNHDESLAYILDRFSIDSVVNDWERLLSGDMKEHIHPIEPINNGSFRLKALKEKIRKRPILRFLSKPFPSIDFYYDIYFRVKDKIEQYRVQ